jgi:hypothetical protein
MMSSELLGAAKEMSLRYAGRCRTCGTHIAARERAVYFRDSKSVACLTCFQSQQTTAAVSTAQEDQAQPTAAGDLNPDATYRPPDEPAIVAGSAGASAQREYERRKNKREQRVRTAHPRIGGFLLAVTDDPQSTKAWATGAAGEMVLGRRLDGLANETTFVLHDRRIPPTKANIDHIVVSASGVFVIDAKKYKGRPSLRVEGGILRPRVEKLMIGSRDRTRLVDGVTGQVGKVRAVLQAANLDEVPVAGMLCFVEADWPLIGGDFTIANIRVLWPKKATSEIARPGLLDSDVISRTYRALAVSFPVA